MLCLRVRLGKNEEGICIVRVGHPGLFTVQNVIRAVPARGCLHAGDVRARAGLGQAERSKSLAGGQRPQEPLLLVLSSPDVDSTTAEAYVNREDCSQRVVHILQLLRGEPQAHVIHSASAITLRKAESGESDFGELPESAGIVVVVNVMLLDGWSK